MANFGSSMITRLLLVLSLATGALCNDFQVFYFVQQWLGSYCTQQGTRCCYPPTGKIGADFTIYGLWPYTSDGRFPYNCGGGNTDEAMLKPMQDSLRQTWPSYTCPQIGRKFWVHEWNKHGTCQSALDEVSYFNAAMNLKKKLKFLQALANAGIYPNNQFYLLKDVKKALSKASGGHHVWVACNRNAQGESQIWQVSVCVDKTGTKVVECPFLPRGRLDCESRIKFIPF